MQIPLFRFQLLQAALFRFRLQVSDAAVYHLSASATVDPVSVGLQLVSFFRLELLRAYQNYFIIQFLHMLPRSTLVVAGLLEIKSVDNIIFLVSCYISSYH